MSDPTSEAPPRTVRNAVFGSVMVGVVGAFVYLGNMPGPPVMPATEQHAGLKEDAQCLSCHHWPQLAPPGAQLVKPLGANHPPPRPKKLRPVMVDGGLVTPTEPQWECLKCHRPR